MPENEDPCTGALQMASISSIGQVRAPPEPDLTPCSRRESTALGQGSGYAPHTQAGPRQQEVQTDLRSEAKHLQVFISEPEVAKTNGPA